MSQDKQSATLISFPILYMILASNMLILSNILCSQGGTCVIGLGEDSFEWFVVTSNGNWSSVHKFLEML